ncbi:MAG: Ppx/GppA family phosphatase [Leptospiraceae bacterium]|nr:Ppx/GppA family phosphatase [Leptospiraceae bacterium]
MMQNQNFAAIDIGTNSFHLIIVKIRENYTFETISKEKEIVRLGEGFSGDKISNDAYERGLNCLKRFQKLAEIHNAKIRAVATSALREASNKWDFVLQVRNELGINIEIVSGSEEARLIYYGILQGLPVFEKKILMIDIGGGSTELLVGCKGEVLFAQSLKLGAVRLTEQFFYEEPESKAKINQCKLYVESMITTNKKQIQKLQPELVIGSSGTIQAIAQIVLEEKNSDTQKSLNGFNFSSSLLQKTRNLLDSSDTLKKKLKIPGLDSRRAEIITAGSIILEQIVDKFSINSITVSEYALREGIIYDTIRKQEGRETHHHDHDSIRFHSVVNVLNSFPYEKEHVETVTAHALKIFDELITSHECDEDDREYLEAASMLHEIGLGISHSSHHKHSYYIIKNSESMLGYNFNEIEIIAQIARYHRKSVPKSKHLEFQQLSINNQLLVKKLAGILRIADGLDRSHQGNVESISCKIQKNLITFYLTPKQNADLHIEVWSAEQKKNLLEEVLNVKVEFIINA